MSGGQRRRPPPAPPRPELLRRPRGAFGWLDAELLHGGWLAEVGPNASAVLVLLALAADQHGASFYSRDRMASALGLDRREIDEALTRLVESGLVAHRPWAAGRLDGVWQLLPLPARQEYRRANRAMSVADVLRTMGFPGAT